MNSNQPASSEIVKEKTTTQEMDTKDKEVSASPENEQRDETQNDSGDDKSKVSNNHKSLSKMKRKLIKIAGFIATLFAIVGYIYSCTAYFDNKDAVRTEKALQEADYFLKVGRYNDAMEIYTKYESKKIAKVYNNLGYMYQQGLGVEKNLKKAEMYYQEAGKNGSEIATNNLLVLYLEQNRDDDVTDILLASYHVHNDERTKYGLSLIQDVENNVPLYTEENDELFGNNANQYRNRLKNRTDLGGWKFGGTYYYTTAGRAYVSNTSKLVFTGSISNGNGGIYYKYSYYTRANAMPDNVQNAPNSPEGNAIIETTPNNSLRTGFQTDDPS